MQFVRVDTRFQPDPSGSGEVLFADAGSVSVVYYAENGLVTTATFSGYAQLVFGYPNDEAASAIYPHLAYGFYEAVDSDWPSRLNAQNSLAFPASHARFNRKHYLASFHETTLNVLALAVSFTADGGVNFAECMAKVNFEFTSGRHLPTVVPRLDE